MEAVGASADGARVGRGVGTDLQEEAIEPSLEGV